MLTLYNYEGDELHEDVEVPIDATIVLPDGRSIEVEAGGYKYIV